MQLYANACSFGHGMDDGDGPRKILIRVWTSTSSLPSWRALSLLSCCATNICSAEFAHLSHSSCFLLLSCASATCASAVGSTGKTCLLLVRTCMQRACKDPLTRALHLWGLVPLSCRKIRCPQHAESVQKVCRSHDTLLMGSAGEQPHLDSTLQHLGEPESVQEVEDEVHAADDPEHCWRYAAWPRVRQLSPAHLPEVPRHPCEQ